VNRRADSKNNSAISARRGGAGALLPLGLHRKDPPLERTPRSRCPDIGAVLGDELHIEVGFDQ
jgi:hypothetical protein